MKTPWFLNRGPRPEPQIQPEMDVCLVLEGTYPYVLGGVASWVHQLIQGLPEVRFGLLSLVADADAPREDRYPVPTNVVWRQDVGLFGGQPAAKLRAQEPDRALLAAIEGFHAGGGASRCPFLGQIDRIMKAKHVTGAGLMASRAAWDLLVKLYQSRGREVSLADYVWTWRAVHQPMLRMLEVELPKAPVFHSTSTGYAGMLTALAKLRQGAGTTLTEHGLFTREREMEIYMADWIYRPPPGRASEAHERCFKGWWRSKFEALGELTYRQCDQLVTLHDANRHLQIAAGAPAERLVVVPNGIQPAPYAPLRQPRDWSGRSFRAGFIGRVVPIKDVKTFLRAIALAATEVDVEGFVLGPYDESPEYFEACQRLAEGLGLGDRVKFLGRVDVKAWLPQLDVSVLTSISESQPLVILEAAAAGVPSIATDVGACRELLEGRTAEDRALGRSGLLTPTVTPEATARALVDMVRDPAGHAAMAEAGIHRVERYYRQEDVYGFYRRLYTELAQPGFAPLAGDDRWAA